MITRYFNSFKCDHGVLTKTSANTSKLYSEFRYYHLLPNELKSYSVPTYNYISNINTSQYDMDYIDSEDSATTSIKLGKLPDGLLSKISEYITEKSIFTSNTKSFKDLFINKVISRQSEFLEKYANILNRDILDLYKLSVAVYLDRIQLLELSELTDVISHGDLCLSNIIFKSNQLQLIDPRGATVECELYMHPLYDLVKLSHSILGGYDLIVRGLITPQNISDLLEFDLSNGEFEEFINNCGYDLDTVRLLEASLFLSMLPLHVDDFTRIEAFILRASQILRI